MNNLEKWAKEEIKLQLKECENDWYTENVLKCAYKVYKKLCRQDHSGASVRLVKSVLDRLIDVKPLSPIKDTPDIWNDVTWDDERKVYQCRRYSGLFKNVYSDGSVDYNDVERWRCYSDSGIYFNSSLVNRVFDKLYPITMPYFPHTEDVYVKESLIDEKNGDFDTVYFKYGDVEKYFTEKDGEWKEITESEYKLLVGGWIELDPNSIKEKD